MAMTLNSDGVEVRFGRDRGKRGARAGVTTDSTKVNEFSFTVDLAGPARTIYTADRNGDGVNDGFVLGLDTVLPAGSKVLSQDVLPLIAPAGGTNYAVGTYLVNGTADTANGITTTAGANGAQIGTVLTADRYVAVTTTGTYTAGRLKVIVRYLIA